MHNEQGTGAFFGMMDSLIRTPSGMLLGFVFPDYASPRPWDPPESLSRLGKLVQASVFGKRIRTASPELPLADDLENSVSNFRKLISEVSMHLSSDDRENYTFQVENLVDIDSWDEADPAPSRETFETFLRIIIQINPSKRPGLGFSANGNIVAAWVSGKNRLALECFPSDEIGWILRRETETGIDTSAGRTRADRLFSILYPYSPNVWFNNDNQAKP